ncbi:MAG: hypothetical protein IJT14_01645, partial [Rickettsiales bacterium]|nr:hypothetical protein [Rickettsiales bacterium]
ERESSLRTSSSLKFKKSFTLIELSIVLLILSLLVGSLLVGRQIVDRAKIHKVITELNFYDNIVHQFYDTYREVPGSMSYKNCMKYSEFQGTVCKDALCVGAITDNTRIADHQDWCSNLAINTNTNAKIIENFDKTDEQVFAVLQASKLMEWQFAPYAGKALNNINRQYFPLVWQVVQNHIAAYANYSHNVRIYMYGFQPRFLANYLSGDKNIDKAKLYPKILNHNVLILRDDQSYSSKRVKHGSALSSALMSQLDAKIDDGRPFTGRLFGLRNNTTFGMTDETKLAQYCYDKTGENVEKAIYNESKNEEYGCNIAYIMSDVK